MNVGATMGFVRLFDRGAGWTDQAPCAGRGAFANIKEDTRITVIDRANENLGVAYLDPGSGFRLSNGEVVCDLGFVFAGIDLGKGSYGFQIAEYPLLTWFPESEVFQIDSNLIVAIGAD